jgi:ketosteroid isomerase-like protein
LIGRLFGSALIRLRVNSRLRREILARAVRDNSEAWNRGDHECLVASLAPDFELQIIGQLPGIDLEHRYTGREGVMRFRESLGEVWGDSARLEPQEIVDFGDRYLVLSRVRGRGKGSGIEVDHPIGLIVVWRGGLVERMDYYFSQVKAIEAAGLST